MKIDLSRYTGRCECGKTHELHTKIVLIESGATARLGEIATTLSLSRGVVVCDTNTEIYARRAAEVLDSALLFGDLGVLVLEANGLHADEKAVALLEEKLPADVGWLMAAGAGSIHDAVRYVANSRGIAFVSFPTAATVDGFVSTVCAMTWHGFKKTMPGVAPVAVVADTDIFSKAPQYLTMSGVGDVLGKYTSLADWEIASLLTEEQFCKRIAALTYEAVDNVRGNLKAIQSGGAQALEQLMFALLLSGISMQMWGNSRPASGAEHHLSHLWEMEAINPHIKALHGEKVGVGVGMALSYYKDIAKLDSPIACNPPYSGLPLELLREKFGVLYDATRQENTPDPLDGIAFEKVEKAFPAIKAIINRLPEPQTLRKEMAGAGCHTTMEDIGLDSALAQDSLTLSPFVRNRLTLARLAKLFVV